LLKKTILNILFDQCSVQKRKSPFFGTLNKESHLHPGTSIGVKTMKYLAKETTVENNWVQSR
jgi:hypothetical protein